MCLGFFLRPIQLKYLKQTKKTKNQTDTPAPQGCRPNSACGKEEANSVAKAETLGGSAEDGDGGGSFPASCSQKNGISRAETYQTPRMCLAGDHANFWTRFKVPRFAATRTHAVVGT